MLQGNAGSPGSGGVSPYQRRISPVASNRPRRRRRPRARSEPGPHLWG
jgi:hypothetical protein